MRIVDAHHHVWDLLSRDQPWIRVDMAPIRRSFSSLDFAAEARPCGVDRSIVVQCIADRDETEELLAAAVNDPLTAGVVGWTDLTAPDVGEQLDALGEGAGGRLLVGIRHVVGAEPESDWLSQPAVLAGLHEVARCGLPYDLLVRTDQVAAAIAAARAVPDGTFVLDHLGKPPIAAGGFQPWADRLEQVARCENMVAKVSGLTTEAAWNAWTPEDLRPYVAHALEVFGSDRLMFGSDWPVCCLSTTYARQLESIDMLFADLSAAERLAIFHDNAIRIYGLEEASDG